MSLTRIIDRALRSGGVATPNEFQGIYAEVLPHLDLAQIVQGQYIVNHDDAAQLRRLVFQNPGEERNFYVGLLYQARQRVLGQVLQRVAEVPASERAATFLCHEGDAARAVSCYGDHDGVVTLRPNHHEEGNSFSDPFLSFLGRILPSDAFIGLSQDGAEGELTSIQLLDGVFFTADNFSEQSMPSETQISMVSLRALVQTEISEHR